jgi:2-polyprenyl-6-methoxyphenol hydroxylase-like FAD-dependent oxidoreductase
MTGPGRILIVGGGIAGLTLASALHRCGLEAFIIERNTHWDPIGGGIAVQPNAMRVLQQLGIAADVKQAGAVIRRWLFRDQMGHVLCDIALEPLWGEVGPFIGIERTKLHDVLKSGALSCRLGTEVTSLVQHDHKARVTLSDDTVGEYDLVIGADGIHSSVRQFTFGAATPIYSDQMVWRSVAPMSPPESDAVQFWLGDGTFFGLCPVGGGRTYGFANVTGPRVHDAVGGRLKRLRARFAAYGELIQDYLAALEHDEQIHCGPIEWLALDSWHRGRVVLIGDAAHASSPMMGQGGSMAMEDALVLAELLQATADVEGALATFAERRRPRVDWVQQQSRAVGEMLRMPPQARDAALRERGAKAFYQRFQPLTIAP